MSAIDVLVREHDEHRRLFEEFTGSRIEFDRIRKALVHHVNEEEAILYPRLLRVETTEGPTARAWKDHNRIMELLQRLDDEENDIIWSALFQELKELHLRHIEEEERDLFPRVLTGASPEFLLEAGEQMIVQRLLEPTEKILYPAVPGSHQL